MSQDSLKKRYISKLASNLVKFGLGFVTLGILPQALGPEAYGNLGYLTDFFTRTIKFLRTGVSAYLPKLSKRQDDKKLIGFYIYYICIIAFMILVGIYGAIIVGFQNIIWPDQKGIFIFAAALFAVLNLISEFFRSTIDAFGYTFRFEMAFILKNIFATGLILLLYFTKTLTLESVFLMQYILLLFVIIAGWRILRKYKIYLYKQLSLTKKDVLRYTKEYYHYSHPLFINGLVVYCVFIGDRWLLQTYFGSLEQGYYTLALKIGSIIFLFTSAMSTLLVREMSLKYKNNNKKEIKELFRRYIPLFYFITVYFAAFVSINAETVTFIIGGNEYQNSSTIVAVMAFYPVFQTYGQLGGTVFLATERTTILRNVGISTGLTGFILSFVFITSYGLGMGAQGLAIKMILVQFVAVNIYLWINTKFLDESFQKFFAHQLIVIVLLLIIAKFSKYLAVIITNQVYINFLVNGVIYSIITLLLIIMYPRIIVTKKTELLLFYHNFKTSVGKYLWTPKY